MNTPRPPSYRELRHMIRDLLPLACDGVDARDRDKASNANEGQQTIEKARAMLARCVVQS